MRFRKDVNVIVFNPAKRFLHIAVQLKNNPGALESVVHTITVLRLNILGSFSSVDPGADTGVWSAFVEDESHTTSQLKEMLGKSPYVVDVVVAESRDGLLVDSIHFPLAWNSGDRAVMMRDRYLNAMFDSIRGTFGSGGEAILYQEGFAYGKESWDEFVGRLGRSFVRSHLKDVLMIYQAVGWFKLERVEHDEGSSRVALSTGGNFECEGAESREPHSHFVRGHLAGAMTAVMGRRMACRETRCVAKGDGGCAFVLDEETAKKKEEGDPTTSSPEG